MSIPRPRVQQPVTFGDPADGNFWVEYPDGLIDITRSGTQLLNGGKHGPAEREVEIDVHGDRHVRLATIKTALVIIDMQKLVV